MLYLVLKILPGAIRQKWWKITETPLADIDLRVMWSLDKNAVQWKINKGPDYGSYAFSIPPFPDCPDTTPASFIFALQEDQYNKLKEDGTKMINVFTSVVYMVDNKKIEKNIEFVMNLK